MRRHTFVLSQTATTMVRVKIQFEVAPNSALPLNNRYEISSWIYKVMSRADADFSTWLHQQGYSNHEKGKRYKLFTFSQPFIHPFKIDKKTETIISIGSKIDLTVSFFGDQSVQNFVIGLFKDQVFSIGTKTIKSVDLRVQNVSILPKKTLLTTQQFRAQTGVCIAYKDENNMDQYISPKHERYEELLTNHLTQKLFALGSSFPDLLKNIDLRQGLKWKLLAGPIKEKKYTLKAHTASQTEVKCYAHNFELTAPIQLMQLLYYGGLGKHTSQGFGFVELIKKV